MENYVTTNILADMQIVQEEEGKRYVCSRQGPGPKDDYGIFGTICELVGVPIPRLRCPRDIMTSEHLTRSTYNLRC